MLAGTARHVVVSTHFDDAVLSVSSVLLAEGQRTTVVTACAGWPGDDVAAGWWDSLSGFASAGEAWRTRRAEDLTALAACGARGVHLDFVDGQYGPDKLFRPDADDLRAAIDAVLEPADVLWLPAGLGWQSDHRVVRNALLPVLASHPGGGMIYADSPYAGMAGWAADDEMRAEPDRWEPQLSTIREQTPLGARCDVDLDHERFRAKLDLVLCHRSQLAPLGQFFPGFAHHEGVLATEVCWPAGVR